MEKYPNLFRPIKIGNYILRNRIEAAPTIFASLVLIPELKDRVIRMVEDRAKGGCAIVVNGELPVNFDDSFRPIVSGKDHFVNLTIDYKNLQDPAFPIFKENAEAIKKHGAIAVAELCHLGEEKPLLDDGILPLGPTAYTKPDGTKVRAFDRKTMDKVKNDFADASAWMKEAGFQGVFIHCGHGWMIGQFLSRRNNKRTDEYGGSIENRARFPMEILEAIRNRCGKDFLIEIRLSGQENMPDGITIEETVEFCKLLEGKGLVDLIHISAGHYYSPARSHEFSTIFSPHGLNAEYAAQVKKAVSIPVAVVGGITSPDLAEQLIAEGKADIVSMGRQMIADPDFANKALNGREDEIRQCIRCTVCYPGPYGEHETDPDAGHLPGLGSCTINPYNVNSFSHHTVYPENMPKPKGKRKVLIVGGGPGGMQAAIDATDRGHQVILIERSNELGGVLKLTDFDYFKKDLYKFKELLIREINKRKIDVRLNTTVTPEIIKEINPDALILAIGAEKKIPPIPGIEKAIYAGDTYFLQEKELGLQIIMIGGGLTGCEVALELAHKGCQVTVIESKERLVGDFIGIHRTALLDQMDEVGIKSYVRTNCNKITDDGVEIKLPNGKEKYLSADMVVYAVGLTSNTEEIEKLKNAIPDIPTFVIGDCKRPAKVGEAIQEGYMAAMSIV